MENLFEKYRWPVEPMEPVQVQEPFDSDDYLFQIKWDGVRCLTYITDKVQLINRHLNERTKQYPELIAALSFLPPGTVLDGEIIVTGPDGKPSFPRILQRDLVRSEKTVRTLFKSHPPLYMVFDILWLKGESFLDRPLLERLETLGSLLENKAPVIYVESVFNNGIALFNATRDEGMEGVVAKEKNSRYLIGKKLPLWKKIKNWRETDVRVGGCYMDETGRPRSLIIGIPDETGFLHVGTVSSGLTRDQISTLKAYFDTRPETECPLKNFSRSSSTFSSADKSAEIRWVPPEIGLKVRFLEWSPDGKLRNPALISFTDYKEV